ncbi:MAG: caspase family protein [Anaerolineae bacterium]|nr:caspase family protein [Anaerolineae bacterium]
MDTQHGLTQLKTWLMEYAPDSLTDFYTLEARFAKNENDELILGISENTRYERNQIMRALNALALTQCGISFNELCEGIIPIEQHEQLQKGNYGGESQKSRPSGSSKVYHGIRKAWAVLVGINHYNDAFIHSLKVCVDDVTAIHQTLSGRYEVARLLTDATSEYLPMRANILGELASVTQAASADDLFLFYFSGHGLAREGESYLLARDTRFSALDTTAIAMRDIRRYIQQSPAHAKIIVLDACHSGASIGKSEPTMTPEFIQRVFEQAEGIAVLASCKENQQSWEWPEKRRSVFTYYLLDALTGKADFEGKGFVTVSDVSNYVTDGVRAWAANKSVPQTPTLQYTVAGDIVLLRYDR